MGRFCFGLSRGERVKGSRKKEERFFHPLRFFTGITSQRAGSGVPARVRAYLDR